MRPTDKKQRSRLKYGAAATALAVSFVGGWEGLQTVAYRDVVGVPTICYGETRGVKLGDSATKEQCDATLIKGLKEFEAGVMRCTPGLADKREHPDERVVALVSFSYNVGIGAYCRSTLARYFNAGRIKDACDQLLRWNRAGGVVWRGLTNRRKAERELCLKGLTDA